VDVPYRAGELEIDMSKRSVTLLDFFTEREVVDALLTDSAVRKALQFQKSGEPPKTIIQLIKVFNEEQLAIETKDGCTYLLPEDLITRFAFHHVEGNKVAIRLALPPDVGACRTSYAQLGILLPIPDSLRSALELARTRKEGFLMCDIDRLFGDRAMNFVKSY
jgi:hypothetical protein